MDTDRRSRGYKRYRSSPALLTGGNVITTYLLLGVEVGSQTCKQDVEQISVDNNDIVVVFTWKSNDQWNIQSMDERGMQKTDNTKVWW